MFTNRAATPRVRSAALALATATLFTSAALGSPQAGPIKVIQLRARIRMPNRYGGNITALSGPHGFLLVDTAIGLSRSMNANPTAAFDT